LLVAATADIHSPKYLTLFRSALREINQFDLLLIAGDLVLKNDYSQLPSLVSAIREVYDGQIIACFGNEEFEQSEAEYRRRPDIIWLDEEWKVLEVCGLKLGIVGSRGALDRPTFWQRAHIKDVRQIYRRRVETMDSLIAGLEADVKIVMTHYAPTYKTLMGENERIWPEMACKQFETVIQLRQPDLWLHGHAHRGTKFEAFFGKSTVMNVSLPARGYVVPIELPRRVGLEVFLK
jgi:Icc-related predicted phosphoesterase